MSEYTTANNTIVNTNDNNRDTKQQRHDDAGHVLPLDHDYSTTNQTRCQSAVSQTSQDEDMDEFRRLLLKEKVARIQAELMVGFLLFLLSWLIKRLPNKDRNSRKILSKETTAPNIGGKKNKYSVPNDNHCFITHNDISDKCQRLRTSNTTSPDISQSVSGTSPSLDVNGQPDPTVPELAQSQDDAELNTMETDRKIRRDQGPYEMQFSSEGEVNLHKHMDACEKNPKHLNFFPVLQFCKEHLPDGYHDDELVECVKALADLTVRITATHTSKDRPPELPRIDTGTKQIMRTGTGWVLIVKEFPVWHNNISCPCQKCRSSKTPETQFAMIIIYTAAHVIYDESEGASATCHLFYDDGNTLNDCRTLLSLTGMTRVKSDVKGDRCEMTYVTHDLQLAAKLHSMVIRFRNLKAKVALKFPMKLGSDDGRSYKQQIPPESENTLTIVVSHPHGCSKQISVGRYVLREVLEDGRDVTKYTYTTATCDGSSGAPVYVVGMASWGMCEHPHRASLETCPHPTICCHHPQRANHPNICNHSHGANVQKYPQLNICGYGFY